jgi:hypothetical protein
MNKNTTQTETIGKGVRLLIEGGKLVEKPSINDILDEIELTFMNPIRSAHILLDCGAASKVQTGMAENLLHTTLMDWGKFQRDLADCLRYPLKLEKKPGDKSLFGFMEDPRFSEYVTQVQLDGRNISDIMESWLKEHNPDYFEDS